MISLTDSSRARPAGKHPAWHLLMLPVLPLITALVALWAATREDSIRNFFPTLCREWWRMTTTWLAQHTFWPEAGWCWHYEVDNGAKDPGGPWMTWKSRFVWRDPVEAGECGWTWTLADAAHASRNCVLPSTSNLASQRGSALSVAIFLTAILCVGGASLLRWVVSENSLNHRSTRLLEARNAAESVAEYGFYQVRARMEKISTFATNAFTPQGAYPIGLPPSGLFTGSRIVPGSLEVMAGPTDMITNRGSSILFFVDPADPNNYNDPLKGKWVFRRDVTIYAKASVLAQGGAPATAYVSETISVRGAPLFAHAIFYNGDMELAPGSTMNIRGPVHANGNVYVSAQGNSVNFRSTLTCTGHIFHAWKSYKLTAQGQTNGTSGELLNATAPVTLLGKNGTQVSMLANSKWHDSTLGYSSTVNTRSRSGLYDSQEEYDAALFDAAKQSSKDFRTHASSTWGGNVQTGANGTQNYTPVAIGAYSEDSDPTDGADDSVNTGRMLIEPPVASDSDQYSAEVEAQKYSTQAGIYITITPASGPTTTTSSSSSVSGYYTTTTTTTTTSFSNPGSITVRTGGSNGAVASTLPEDLIRYRPYEESTSTAVKVRTSTGVVNSTTVTTEVDSGMYDQRRGSGQDLVELDMTKLKAAVIEMQKAADDRNSNAAIDGLEPGKWTGIIYLEVAGGPSTRLDGSTVAGGADANRVAVRLINGNTQMPSYGTAAGLTVATNAPVYIKGHYNDDGTSPSAETPKSGEVPCAVAADSVTLLSAGFDDEDSKSDVRPNATANATVAAALLTGQTPTDKEGNSRMSGGAHNLIRFLENWTNPGLTTTVRGSLVSLFESRVATEPWKIDYYSAPTRNWGFSQQFLNGTFPPGTPKVISYRRVNYSDLTKAQYESATASLR